MRKLNVVLGVTGGIACYKSCEIVSRLVKQGINVDVIMTKNAQEFVKPLSFETMSANPVICDTFERARSWEVEHISLAKKADIMLIAPASANVIGKFANGICDDMLSTTFMASNAIKVICPAMNTAMFRNPIFRENLNKLKGLGCVIIEPTEGRLACGDVGEGKMSEPIDIVREVVRLLTPSDELKGKRVLITAGGTQEPIDSVRVITNHSSGKMGMALVKDCIDRGAQVTLIKGIVSVDIPYGIYKVIDCETTQQMYDAVMSEYAENDYIIKAAAPSDYKVAKQALNKIKGDNITLNLIKNPDIAAQVGKVKGERKLVVFSAETENLIENAKAKLISKNADIVVANDVTMTGAGFNTDTNIVTILTKDGEITEYGMMSKSDVAKVIVDTMLK